MGQEGADIPTFFTLHNETPPRQTTQQMMSNPPLPAPYTLPPAKILLYYVKCISSAYIPSACIPSSLLPPPQGSTRPLSFISIFHISHTLLLPSRPSLFQSAFYPMLASHMLGPFAQSLPLKIQTCSRLLLLLLLLSSDSPLFFICSSFCLFANLVCFIHGIIVGPGSSTRGQPSSPPSFSIPSYPFPPDLAVCPLVQ